MKKQKHKTKISSVIFVLMLTIIAAVITYSPIVKADDIDTYAFLSVAPNPVGVGQSVVVSMWLNLVPPQATVWGGENYWPDFQVTIEKPDGTTQIMGPYDSDPVGSNWFYYTPDTVGTHTLQFSFPGFDSAATGNYYKPSTSPEVELTVQQDAIEPYPTWPLPDSNQYWERPIDAENREWWSISGSWLGLPVQWGAAYNASGRFNPYTTAPNTAHIVWTKEMTFGGLVGGEFGSKIYYMGLQYEQKFYPVMIIHGRLYYNLPLSNKPQADGFVCVDVRTGEQLWWQNDTITFGQLYDYESPNQHGVIPYLWEIAGPAWGPGPVTYRMYDAYTGKWLLDLANASRGTLSMSSKGDVLVYILNGMGNWLAMWNSSSIPAMLGGTTGTSAWQWRPPFGATLDWRDGIQWNVTLTDVPGVQNIAKLSSDVIYTRATFRQPDGTVIAQDVAYSIKEGDEGVQLWGPINRTAQPSRSTGVLRDGVFTEFVKETMTWYGYDVYTGELLWGPTEPYSNGWGMYSSGINGVDSAYGRLYAMAYDGMVHCYNLTTGEHLWDYYTGSSGLETPYGHYPLWEGLSIADGKIFACTYEHSPGSPPWRGAKLHVVDAETGDGVWTVLGWFQGPVIADGHVVTLNGADNRIYSFGKGLTSTTVSIQDDVVSFGDSVLIKGTVTDQSPGAKTTEVMAKSPNENGIPCVADEYISQWMEYLYMQKPCPEYYEGVEVVLTTLDPNGNTYELGRTTTDTNGVFGCLVDPPVLGKYQITATFEGSESYFKSSAGTYLWVQEAPSPAQPIETEPPTTEPPTTAPPTTEPPTTAPPTTELPTETPPPTGEAPSITTEVAIVVSVAIAAIIGISTFYWAFRRRQVK